MYWADYFRTTLLITDILTYHQRNIADCPIFHSEQHNIVPPLGRPKTWIFEKLIK